ncbi:MAG: hypothetical protein E6R14_05325 [Thermomicrobiales bacterium]|nr:MAG: hypothetical protein E6R14_05325 [Thermomicrobiales bacterium]
MSLNARILGSLKEMRTMNGGHSAHILDQSRPTIFIGSSTEGLIIAEAVQANLSRVAQAQLWNGGFSEPTKSFLETLCKKVGEFDFAVLILTADDWVTIRGSEQLAPRDNVLFELGLFIGSIGRERTFFMCNKNDYPRIPSDLLGVTSLTFTTPNNPGNLTEWVTTVGPACNQVASLIQAKGALYRPFEDPMLLTLQNLRSAAQVQHQAFRDEIAIECIQWRKQSDSWSKRFLRSSQGYERLLLNVYKLAKRTMFSTSIPQYRGTWMSTLGDNILQIQKSMYRDTEECW